jgi:hypothetical protein
MHLTPDQLIDLAEDAAAEAAAPHLQSCEVCRHQVISLRATMSAAADADIPEPSPLFWDHLSHRVREEVARDDAPASRTWWTLTPRASWRGWAIASVAAAVAVSIYVTAPRTLTPASTPFFAGRRSAAAVSPAPLEPFGAFDDPALTLFADLAEQIDPQAITETGWSSHVGAVDEALASLTADERRELQRLLKEELPKT